MEVSDTTTAVSRVIVPPDAMVDNSSCIESVATNLTDPYESFYRQAQFLTGLVFYPVLCSIGLTGNTLVLIVLSHRKMASSTNTYLRTLAVADIIKLLNDLLYFIVSILMRKNPEAANAMMGYMYPISHYIFNASVCVSSWLTVCVGVDRFICVCLPTRAKLMCTMERARIISIVAFISMSVVTIPSLLRYKKVHRFNPVENISCYEIGLTSLFRIKYMMLSYSWIINLLRSVIPLCVLIVLNTCIIRALQKERIQGKKMTAKNWITFMLIVVILVFVVCVTPDAIITTIFDYGYVEASYLVKGIREFTDALLAVNSAVNFVIYCICSRGFRDCFCDIFCSKYGRYKNIVRTDKASEGWNTARQSQIRANQVEA